MRHAMSTYMIASWIMSNFGLLCVFIKTYFEGDKILISFCAKARSRM